MIDRRKFLKRSVLSAGSVLFSSMLVESCTKNLIYLPGENKWPLLPGLTIDWNDAAKTAVTTGLEMIPEAGEILGPLVDIFWPKTKEDVWGEVKAQTEALVDQKIAAAVYQQVTEDLQGLNNSNILYLNELKNGTTSDIKTQWIVTKNLFVNALPHFQSQGNELPLLGLFAQFANMYLALLRDGVAFGASWGRSAGDQQQDITDLKTAISTFTIYTTTTYNAGRFNVLKKTPKNNLLCEPFRSLNNYDRPMALTILDFRDTWQYYDITQYPTGTKVVLTREIYSDPMGSYDLSNNENLVIPLPPPTQPPIRLSLWGGAGSHTEGVQVSAVQVTYPAGSGPGGVTQTPRMGAQNVGSNQPPYGALVDISPANPVVAVQCTYATYWVDRFQLMFYDGTKTNVIGGTGDPNPTATANWTFYNELMSSILITGASSLTGQQCAACIVFGFQNWQSPSATLRAIGALYVTSPKEWSEADFAKAFPGLAISPNNLITHVLKAARKAHWAYIAVRVKEIR